MGSCGSAATIEREACEVRTLRTIVFCRPTRSARTPIAMRATLFTAVFTARKRDPVVLEYDKTETE